MSQDEYLTGYVLKTENFKERDKIISFYSQEYGKSEILVRGGRRIKSKLAPIISEPFALLNLKVVKGKKHYHLIGGEIKQNFKNIYLDYEKLTQVNFLFSQINKLIKFKKPENKILSLIIKFLKTVDQKHNLHIQNIYPAFLIKFLSFLGYRPEIKRCVVCQKSDIKHGYFDFEKGGLVCQNHESNSEHAVEISESVLKILQKLLYKDFDFLTKQKFNHQDLQTAEKVINQFSQWHAE